ncbi:ABC-type transporter, integral membrane subunit [Caldalkalibacillus thermarum TA2.A1]|uniref:ABC-type transporter, integral membrane subunit n=1 Tax=Caldalkalibacillus thermarum (strain TA2.A1) TaxID=986075 RepID=F5L7N9_CALTT|nr:iron ABC transporter permease [Caldalkalibacillus thermarum]EGL82615.1 ABC-type transporter, integral membrane subunit [Caldalkalibacillus thermarum TA2.A1]QZT33327.1 iron ABC transporter permease [Caldalkalibacillus thermarum TA2.A1]
MKRDLVRQQEVQHKELNRRQQEVRESASRTLFRWVSFYWRKHWNGNPPDVFLLLLGLITALVMGVPIFYVVWRSLFAGTERWLRLLDSRIPELLQNTLLLTVAVTTLAVIIGVSLAWLVNRCQLPGRRMWQWLLALPLVIPPYVGAMTYVIVFGPRGWVASWWAEEPWLSQVDFPFNIYSFWGVFFALTMFTYPYVFLIASAALRKMNRNFEDIARSQGLTPLQTFWKVNLPFLRPAIGAGAILVSLYVLSDFGAIAMLRYTTFTMAIYYQMGSYDRISASVLSLVLIVITLFILWIEKKTRANQKYYQTNNSFREPDLLPLGRWKIPALIYVLFIFFLSVALPIMVLLYWSNVGIRMGALDARFWGYVFNSMKVAGLAAVLSMLFALPVIYLKSRYPSLMSKIIDKLAYAGYALPGVIVALGIVFIFNQYVTWLYNTFFLVVLAYFIRFLPQALQAGEASLSLVSPRVDEAARSLGQPPWKVLFTVILPLVMPGILAGGALVFVSSIKELPATLLLRPPGFDTLAVRVWVEAREAIYHLAAPAALLIILVSILPLKWLLRKY